MWRALLKRNMISALYLATTLSPDIQLVLSADNFGWAALGDETLLGLEAALEDSEDRMYENLISAKSLALKILISEGR